MSIKDSLLSGFAAVSAGKSVTSDNIDSGGADPNQQTNAHSSSAEDSEVTRAEESTVDTDQQTETGDTPGDSPDSGNASGDTSEPGSKQATPSKEFVTITDDRGRRKIEVDFSNRDQLTKFVQLAYGARKWQTERDQAIQQHKDVSSKLTEREADWSKLDQAFQQGPEHLFDTLMGRKGAFDEHVQKRIKRDEFLRNASPAEVRALQAQELAEKQSRENERLRKDNEEFKQTVAKERKEAQINARASQINPAFDKHRFAGTLGDEADEHMFDQMLWNTAIENLKPYEDKGLLTQELIDKEFNSVASAIRKRISVQADRKASAAVAQKKQEAVENVQSKVKSGYKSGGNADEARQLLNKGDLKSVLKGWGKYRSVFGK